MRQWKQKFLPRTLIAGACAHAGLRGGSDCLGNIHSGFLKLPGPSLQNPVLQKGLKRRSTAGMGQKCLFLICPLDHFPAKGSKISASWAGSGWEQAPAAGLVVSASEMPLLGKGMVTSVSMSPGVQPASPPHCSDRERARARPVPELEKRARREAGTLPGRFLTQKSHLSTHWPKLFTTGH